MAHRRGGLKRRGVKGSVVNYERLFCAASQSHAGSHCEARAFHCLYGNVCRMIERGPSSSIPLDSARFRTVYTAEVAYDRAIRAVNEVSPPRIIATLARIGALRKRARTVRVSPF